MESVPARDLQPHRLLFFSERRKETKTPSQKPLTVVALLNLSESAVRAFRLMLKIPKFYIWKQITVILSGVTRVVIQLHFLQSKYV